MDAKRDVFASRVRGWWRGSLWVGLALAANAQAAGPPFLFDDFTEYTYESARGFGNFSDFTVNRALPGPIRGLRLTLVSGTADDIGYVGDLLVTDEPPSCSAVGIVQAPVEVTSEVTVEVNRASFLLRARENCCCQTGWGSATAEGRRDARFHWEAELESVLETLDPHRGLIDDGRVTQDITRLSTGGSKVVGAAADGATRVVLRYTADTTGQLSLSLVGGQVEADGGLSVDGTARLASVTVPVQVTPEGFQGFAVFWVPDHFERPGDFELGEREISFLVQFTPSSGTPQTFEVPFTLVRPPVVLVHGLWSGSDTWNEFGLLTDPRFKVVRRADYRDSHARPFADNLTVPLAAILSATNQMSRMGYAATRADVAGHSMGGLLLRNHVGRRIYATSRNFYQGDVHRLLTMNTPHTGSPLANFLYGLTQGSNARYWIRLANLLKRPIDQGAIQDLSTGSTALSLIDETPVSSHALVGTGGPTVPVIPDLLPPQDALLWQIVALAGGDLRFFDGFENDLVVGRLSQEGGMPAHAVSVFEGLESLHFRATSNPFYAIHAALLWGQSTETLFARFPAPRSLAAQQAEQEVVAPRLLPRNELVVEDGLFLSVDPPTGPWLPGTVVTATVSGANGFSPERVLVGLPGRTQLLTSPPFVASFEIPFEALGLVSVSAFARDSAGNLSSADSVDLMVSPECGVLALELTDPFPVLVGVGSERSLGVLGEFCDGGKRDLGASQGALIFESEDPAVVSVDAQGRLTAHAVGSTQITVRGDAQWLPFATRALEPGGPDPLIVVAEVEVIEDEESPPNGLPIADAGPDRALPCESPTTTPVELDGRASSDPDGDPLSYSWSGSFGTASGAMASVVLPLGSHEISLRVEDGRGGADEDTTLVTVGDGEPPAINSMSAQPATLWPPNHKMRLVTVTAIAADRCGVTTCSIRGVTSNEPIEGDVEVLPPLQVRLRAERDGGGSGRVYAVEVGCGDGNGNLALTTVEVRVPHDQGH